MEQLSRMDTAPLFPGLHAQLMALLRALDLEDWDRPTVAGSWQVRDVVAHLLDVQLRRLSGHRDGHAPAPDRDLSEYEALVDYLNDLNAVWVSAMRRVSPALLLDLLDTAGQQLADFVTGIDPLERALFPVAWEDSGWSVFCGKGPAPSASISLPAKEAWRVFFNAASAEEVQSLASCSGDPDLVEAVLQLRSVMV